MKAVKEPVASYDPSKKYKWSEEDTFTFSGGEFGLLLNTLRSILSTPDAKRILLADRANLLVEEALAKAVEAGIVKEDVEDNPSSL